MCNRRCFYRPNEDEDVFLLQWFLVIQVYEQHHTALMILLMLFATGRGWKRQKHYQNTSVTLVFILVRQMYLIWLNVFACVRKLFQTIHTSMSHLRSNPLLANIDLLQLVCGTCSYIKYTQLDISPFSQGLLCASSQEEEGNFYSGEALSGAENRHWPVNISLIAALSARWTAHERTARGSQFFCGQMAFHKNSTFGRTLRLNWKCDPFSRTEWTFFICFTVFDAF